MEQQSTTIEAILDRAIAREEEAYTIYSTAAKRTTSDPIRQRLEELAKIELGHKTKLLDTKAGNVRWAIRRAKAERVVDLRLSDHLTGGSLDPGADFQDVLLFAAQREKAAHEFYKAMSEQVEDPLHKNIFEMLAAEELRHKYLVEKTYEEVVYKDF
ncbi:MAG: ferritin family protein [Chloroflexi bacterium]|nr:ferritin family protein [Chloroflexota bacterium]